MNWWVYLDTFSKELNLGEDKFTDFLCVYVLIFVLSETWTDAYNIPDQSFDYI